MSPTEVNAGTAKLETWTVVHQGARDIETPYVLAWVERDGGGTLGRFDAKAGDWVSRLHRGDAVLCEERDGAVFLRLPDA